MPIENSFAITSQVSIVQKDRKSIRGIHNKIDINFIYLYISLLQFTTVFSSLAAFAAKAAKTYLFLPHFLEE